MTESALYKKIKTNLLDKSILLQRIEQQRVPDIFYRTKQRDGWIELKIEHNQKQSLIHVQFRPGQFAWLNEYMRHGGLAFLFMVIREQLFIFKGWNIHHAYVMPPHNEKVSFLSVYACAAYHELLTKVDWTRIYNILSEIELT